MSSAAIARNGASPPKQPAATSAAAAPPTELTANKWLVSIAIMFGALMSAIDMSVVNVALPQIQGNVGATQQEITWIGTGYMISVVILMPLCNWLSLTFGRKNLYLASLVIFTGASIMCGLSHTLTELVVWRIVQGAGAGIIQPVAQAIFREAFPPNEQGVAMALFGFVVMFGPAIGPTLGGYITDNFQWPWIFFINLPIGIVGFLVALRLLYDPPYMRRRSGTTIDAIGIGLLVVCLASLQTLLEQGQEDDWFDSRFICMLTVTSVVALIGFVAWELTHESPAVNLRILKNPTFASATVIGSILGMGLFAGLFLLPQYMQLLLGYDATQSGLALMPRSIMMMAMMPVAGLLYNRIGAKVMITTGLVVTSVTQWWFSLFTLQTGYADIVIPQVIQSAGFSLIFVSLSTVALAAIPKPMMTSAAGLYNLIRQLGGSFGMAIVVTLLVRHADVARTAVVANMTDANPALGPSVGGITGYLVTHGYSAPSAHAMALGLVYREAEMQSLMISYDYVFLIIGVLFLICIPLVFLIKTVRMQPNAPRQPAGPAESDGDAATEPVVAAGD